MHLPVWIITGVTDPMELGWAFREAEQLAEPFRESNISGGGDPDGEILAPVSWDWQRTGGRYNVGKKVKIPDRGFRMPRTGGWAF